MLRHISLSVGIGSIAVTESIIHKLGISMGDGKGDWSCEFLVVLRAAGRLVSGVWVALDEFGNGCVDRLDLATLRSR